MARHADHAGYGVDISRNFDTQWKSCPNSAKNTFAPDYSGPKADSEKETIFIKQVIDKRKDGTRAYVSIRRNGHGLYYPYAYSNTKYPPLDNIQNAVDDIVNKVNQRAGNIQPFKSESIFNMLDGKAGCGSSVDYAAGLGIKLAFEMRVFLQDEMNIIEKFHSLPRGYESQLRAGYWAGVKQVYEVVTNDEKYKIYSSNTNPKKKPKRRYAGRKIVFPLVDLNDNIA